MAALFRRHHDRLDQCCKPRSLWRVACSEAARRRKGREARLAINAIEFGATGRKTRTLQRAQPSIHFVTQVQSPPDNSSDQSTGQQRHGREHQPARSANEVIFSPAHRFEGIEGDWLPWQAVLLGQGDRITDRFDLVQRPAARSAQRTKNRMTPKMLAAR